MHSPKSTLPLSVYVPPHWQVDPAQQRPIGVICGPELFVFACKDPRQNGGIAECARSFAFGSPVALRTAFDVVEIATDFKLSAIWMVPIEGAMPSKRDPKVMRDWGRAPLASTSTARYVWHELSARGGLGGSAELAGVVAQEKDVNGKGKGEPIRVLAPWVQDGWRMRGVLGELAVEPEDRAIVVASGILLASFALGAQFRFSPSHTGLSMVRTELDRWQKRGIELGIPEDIRRRLDELRATPIEWARPIAGTPPADLWSEPEIPVWKYDRNGSYVVSAREVPVGAPVHVTPQEVAQMARQLGGSLPIGVYRVSAGAPDWFDVATMPGPFHHNGRWVGEVVDCWVWEPQLRLAVRSGWQVNVHEAYIWQRSQIHDLFRSWQDRVWNARSICNDMFRVGEGVEETFGKPSNIRPAAKIAGGLVKHVGVATIGRLVPTAGRATVTAREAQEKNLPILWHFTDDRGRETGMVEVEMEAGRTDLIRPDWWSIIISNAVERLLSQVYLYARHSTVLLYVDALYSFEPVVSLAGSRDKRGGFKEEGVRLMRREVAFGGDPIKSVRAWAHGEEAGDGN